MSPRTTYVINFLLCITLQEFGTSMIPPPLLSLLSLLSLISLLSLLYLLSSLLSPVSPVTPVSRLLSPLSSHSLLSFSSNYILPCFTSPSSLFFNYLIKFSSFSSRNRSREKRRRRGRGRGRGRRDDKSCMVLEE